MSSGPFTGMPLVPVKQEARAKSARRTARDPRVGGARVRVRPSRGPWSHRWPAPAA